MYVLKAVRLLIQALIYVGAFLGLYFMCKANVLSHQDSAAMTCLRTLEEEINVVERNIFLKFLRFVPWVGNLLPPTFEKSLDKEKDRYHCELSNYWIPGFLDNADEMQRYSTEYLNTLTPSGVAAHRLFIKEGMPLMLLRNLNPKMGLCNGTKLIFDKIHNNYLLECTIAGGEYKGRKVLIPRITMRPKDTEYVFEWSRRQFPVRLGFAMTINKSQGQTLQNVGVWLSDPCFSHGQLYVAVSRVVSPKTIKFAIRKIDNLRFNFTRNVVYKEVLNN